MKFRNIFLLIFLSAIWGNSYIFIKILVSNLSVVLITELRILIAAVILFFYSVVVRQVPNIRKNVIIYFLLSALNTFIPFILISYAQNFLSSSEASLLVATTPLFTLLIYWVYLKENIQLIQWVGVIFGMMSILFLFEFNNITVSLNKIIPVSIILFACLLYAIGGIYITKIFTRESLISLVTGQQIVGSLVLSPILIIEFETILMMDSQQWISIFLLGALCTGIASLIYFYLLQEIGVIKTQTVTYLIPIFSMIFGGILLQEKITLYRVLGLIFILISIFLIFLPKYKK